MEEDKAMWQSWHIWKAVLSLYYERMHSLLEHDKRLATQADLKDGVGESTL
jgi:hypothetical protein